MSSGDPVHSGTARALARVNVRATPARSGAILGQIEAGSSFPHAGLVTGEEVSGNDRWFLTPNRTYVWSGACVNEPAAPHTAPFSAPARVPSGVVRLRSDGTIRPLPEAEIRTRFGAFSYEEGRKGAIVIDPDWEARNIVSLDTPLLKEEGFAVIRVHRLAGPFFAAVFDEIEQAGLEGRILSCGGTFVPRHKNWDPTRGLSSHSWGIAIDLNVAWNGYGAAPAGAGRHGSVSDLAPIFARHGFAWGGDFAPPQSDGMHFELARTDMLKT